MADLYTRIKLSDLDDAAAKHGFGHAMESRFPNQPLGSEQTGLSLQFIKPNTKQPFAHSHDEIEEIYVVIGGSGTMKLDNEEIEVARLDAIRVSSSVTRAFTGGPEGLEVLAIGPIHAEDKGNFQKDW